MGAPPTSSVTSYGTMSYLAEQSLDLHSPNDSEISLWLSRVGEDGTVYPLTHINKYFGEKMLIMLTGRL